MLSQIIRAQIIIDPFFHIKFNDASISTRWTPTLADSNMARTLQLALPSLGSLTKHVEDTSANGESGP